MVDILNYGALNLAMAIGYRTGLFDVMAGFDRPQPISRIAETSGLNARYIREWLGIMVTGDIVDLIRTDDGENRYGLPREYTPFLTRESGKANLSVYTQEIPLLTTCSLEQVIEGFRTGDGIPYSCYPRFQAFMSELSNAKHQDILVDRFLPSVKDGALVSQLKKGIRVCDFGCGEGVALLLMAKAFPKSRFVGIDMAEEAIREGERQAEKQNLRNAAFIARDVVALEGDSTLSGAFDYITAFDAIHDQTRPLLALRTIGHMLAPGGIFSMIDIAASSDHRDNMAHPMGPFLYTVSLMHCMPVGLFDGGMGLGMMWGREKALELLEEAGFQEVAVLEMEYDAFNLHYLCRQGK
jgi:2-polyprenyl-3-methyl-5-hydroxy-6-metoxy-1,4-benzoquinol methylase